jgi:Ca-activated chloride channel family protein
MLKDRDRNITLLWLCIAAIAVLVGAYLEVRQFELAHPVLLLVLIPIWIAALLHVWRAHKLPMVSLPTLGALIRSPLEPRAILRPLPFTACITGASFLVLSLVRPQSKESWEDVQREGIDIVISLDISTSMLARDLRPDRLEASKRVAVQFIDGRVNDRIGLVVYEGEAFTQCPITTDHRVLKDLFLNVRSGLVDGGTAVGLGLATAVNRLRDSEAKSKVIILLTDGVNNAGAIQPIDAAQIAAQFGIRVYTIGVGTRGKALSPVSQYRDGQYHYEYVKVEIDEEKLKEIADITGGKYFRATDEQKLKEIYDEIDQMETTRVKVTEHSTRKEEFHPFAMIGAGLLVFGFLLDRSILRTIS